MKLTDWAKKQGVTYRTAWNHFKSGKIPTAYKLETGTIIVPDEKAVKKDYVAIYTRVSSSQNRINLEGQANRVSSFCSTNGWIVSEIVKECASGLNDTRPKLMKLLLNKQVTKIVVEHKDRLTRFGFNYIEKLSDIEIIVVNKVIEDEKDLMQDFVSLVTSFCARLYGKRRTKRISEKVMNEINNDTN